VYLDIWRRLDAVGYCICHVRRSQHGHAIGLLPRAGFEDFRVHHAGTDALKSERWGYITKQAYLASSTHRNLGFGALFVELLSQDLG